VLLVRSLPYTMIHREGTCFEDLHISSICQHTWIMVMCSLRAKLCSIHMLSLSAHPYWLSLMFGMSYFACFECGACMHLHVLELFYAVYMHALKACMCMHVSQAWHICARACSYQRLSVLLRFVACIKRRECFCISMV
jgi:hypothetical protein